MKVWHKKIRYLYGQDDITLPNYKPRRKAEDIGHIGESANGIDRTAQERVKGNIEGTKDKS